LEELRKNELFYKTLPNGIYTGFRANDEVCPKDGIIALLGYPRKPPGADDTFRYKGYELLYTDYDGTSVLVNQKEILDALAQHKDEPRFVPQSIDHGEASAIERLSSAFKTWLKHQIVEETRQNDGTTKQTMGKAQLELLNRLKSGSKAAVQQIQKEAPLSERYDANNLDLITWFILSKTV
jgi:hypothetical protein